ncbi:hypothetical protein Y032_0976g3270 [Ancylostoma ceylanicum]|uniref:Uncharacterized protein n=1 Tax=Ancylostoma ceylanicum TaxID=53326 RepID=A0A016W862_9BILA|nr:hypothetical protein Y032_0976g3270 [Ancylostoma ceylanicum]
MTPDRGWVSGGSIVKKAGGRVRLAQTVVKTTLYGSSLPKEWRKRQDTGPPWPSSGVIDRTVVNTPDNECALAMQ